MLLINSGPGVCNPSFASRDALLVASIDSRTKVDQWGLRSRGIPVEVLLLVVVLREGAWLTHNHWIWQGYKLPCKLDHFTKGRWLILKDRFKHRAVFTHGCLHL